MNESHRRWLAWGGALGALALLGGCVATGPVGYDDYPYYGSGAVGGPAYVDIDVYSGSPRYWGGRPAYPYYAPGRAYDPRWGGYRRSSPPRVVPVPVPVPSHVRPPGVRPPVARPAVPGQQVRPQSIPGGRAWISRERPVPRGDAP